jgi:zinc protease
MNYTLGGAFASRINMNLREEHGYTYGAQSQYSFYREGGNFLAGGLVRTDVTGPAAKELLYEISRFPTSPPTPAELKEAQDARIQSIPSLFETTAATASAATSIFLNNRPLDYYTTLPDKYRSVTAADVTRVAKEDVHPDNLIILAVGDKAKIEPGLKDANLGPIEFRTPTGELVK